MPSDCFLCIECGREVLGMPDDRRPLCEECREALKPPPTVVEVKTLNAGAEPGKTGG